MNDQQRREILQRFLPGSTVPFLSKDGRGMVLAVDGPADGLIEICRRQGYLIDALGRSQESELTNVRTRGRGRGRAGNRGDRRNQRDSESAFPGGAASGG